MIYTSFVALAQEDMKKLIAYSSVAHMGVVTIGIFTFNVQGISGALFQMLSHGIVSGALFLIVGVVYDRIHTREIARYGGLADRMPSYALVFMLFTMASIGLPGTSGFVGEFLVIVGAAAGQLLARAAGRHGDDPGRGLHAVSVSPGDLRPHHARRPAQHPRPQPARVGGVRAADRADVVDGHLPVQLHQLSSMRRVAAMVQHHHAALAATTVQASPRQAGALMNWTLALPEIVLACVGMAILIFGVLRKQDSTLLCTMFTIGGFLIAGLLVLTRTSGFGFNGQFVTDPFSAFNQILILSGAALVHRSSRSTGTARRASLGSSSRC